MLQAGGRGLSFPGEGGGQEAWGPLLQELVTRMEEPALHCASLQQHPNKPSANHKSSKSTLQILS